MRARSLLFAGLIAALASRAGPAGAGARPEVVAGFGATTAVQGVPGNGGASLSLAMLWPLEDHFRLGLVGFMDDLGEDAGRLRDPAGGTWGRSRSCTRPPGVWPGGRRLIFRAAAATAPSPLGPGGSTA